MEQWKEISGYEGYYEVSNHGNVRSLPHKVRTKGNAQRISPGRVLVQKTSSNRYKKVQLSKYGKGNWKSVHRLVAYAFCDGWFEGAVVNHKDENPMNNHADNLEWCSQSYNCKYGHRNDAMIEQRSRKVERIIGNVIVPYGSIQSAARMTGVSAAHICQCCKGKRNIAGGTKWRYSVPSK